MDLRKEHPKLHPDWIRFISPNNLFAERDHLFSLAEEIKLLISHFFGIKKWETLKYSSSLRTFQEDETKIYISVNRAFLYIDFPGSAWIYEQVTLENLYALILLINEKTKQQVAIEHAMYERDYSIKEIKFYISRFDPAKKVDIKKEDLIKLYCDGINDFNFKSSINLHGKSKLGSNAITFRTEDNLLNIYNKGLENEHKRNFGTIKQAYYRKIIGDQEYWRMELSLRRASLCEGITKEFYANNGFIDLNAILQKFKARRKITRDQVPLAIWEALFAAEEDCATSAEASSVSAVAA